MSTWLIDTALYTGLLIGLVLVLRRPVGQVFGPTVAYGLWALPLLRFVLPPLVLPASMAPQSAAPTLSAAESGLSPQATALVAEALGQAPPDAAVWAWNDTLVPLWLGGAALFLGWRILAYRRMRRGLLERARPVGEVGPVRLVETAAVASPVAFGLFDKVVALPPRFMVMDDREGRDLAIAHELAHHRGHDIAANFLAQPLLALHWFNPLAWIGWRAMRRDQEAACDARVMSGRCREEKAAYASLIAGFAAGPRLALATPMACPMIGEKSIIHRLRSLSMSEVSMRRRWAGRLLLAGSAIALPLTASVSYAAEEQGTVREIELAPSAASPEGQEGQEGQPTKRVRVVKIITEDGDEDADVEELSVADGANKQVRVFKLRRGEGDGPMPDGERHIFRFMGDGPLTEEQRKKLEEMGKRFEAEDWAEFGEKQAKLAERMVELQGKMPQIELSCQDNENGTRSWTDDKGRPHVIICERAIVAKATLGLRQARSAIANNRDISDEVRRDVLQELDAEIARIEKEG